MRKLFGLLLKTEQVRLEVIKLFFDRGVRRVLTDPCIEEHQSGSALFWGQALIQRFIRLKYGSKWARFLSYAYKTAHWKGVEKNFGEKSVFADFSWFAKVKRNEVSGTLEPNY